MADYTKNLHLEKPLPEEFYDVSVQNGNMEKIDAALAPLGGATTAQDVINTLGALLAVAAAAAYDPEGSYAVGDYCTHGGKLHKCNTPIESGEPWNSEHWTATTVAAELAEVRASLSNMFAKTYTAPSQIGITLGSETIESVSAALSNGSILMYGVGASANTEIYPFRLCTIVVYRIDASRVAWTAIDKSTGKNATGNWSNDLGFTGWESSVIATPPEVRNLTLQSGFAADGDCTFFVTQESAAFLAGGVSGTLSANQDTQIGTLPADACPAAQRRRPAVTNTGPAYIDIHTDGTVWAHPFAAASQCWFDCSFVAEGGA